MGEKFLLQDVSSMLLSFVAFQRWNVASTGNEISCQVSTLNRLSFLQRAHQHIHHFLVALIKADLFQDIRIRNNIQCSEDNHKWNVLLDIWQLNSNGVVNLGTIRTIHSSKEFDCALRHHSST